MSRLERGCFRSYLRKRHPETGNYPFIKAVRNGEQQFLYSVDEFEAYRQSLVDEIGPELVVADLGDEGAEAADLVVQEYRECAALKETVEAIESAGFSVKAFLPPRRDEEAVPIARLEYDGASEDISSLRDILFGIRRAGEKSGADKTRFKGLGEMNADELRLTTMDPATRQLIQVRAEDAMAADRMFSILMGPDVEPRREFIEKHALDVKELDV